MNNNQWVDLNLQEIPKVNKKKFPFKLILIILIIALASGGAYLGYEKFFSKMDYQNNAKVNNEKDKKETNDEDSKEQQKPLVTKDCVKDADYKTENLKESYLYYKEVIKLSDIVVPYLDIDTSAAKEINNEIKKLYKEFIEMYISFSNEGLTIKQNETESYNYVKTNYTYTVENNLVSILIKVNRTSRGGSEVEEYYTFNYDATEEKYLSFEDICDKLNINYEDAIKEINDKLEQTLDEHFEIDLSLSRNDILPYIKSNKDYFNNQIKEKEGKFYIDENNNLNVILHIEHPFEGRSFYDETLTITK